MDVSPSEMFAEFLNLCKPEKASDEDKDDLCSDLYEALSDLRIDANGGNRLAREEIEEIYDLLDDELDSGSLSLPDIILVGKILSDAGWDIPDKLRQSAAAAFNTFQPELQDVSEGDILAPLREVMGQAEEDPFEAYEFIRSMLATFPAEYGLVLLNELIFSQNNSLNNALIGFFLHEDVSFAQSVATGLAQTSTQSACQSLTIERLVRMRPWLPDERQEQLDNLIKAMRKNALPPAQTTQPKTIKCFASMCDGAGVSTIMVTQRVGKSYQMCSVMIKATGVTEVLVFRDLPKSQMDIFVRKLKSSMPTSETDVAQISRLIALAIADNLRSKTLPPFRLVEVCECLELGSVRPDHTSPSDIFLELLSELPPAETNEEAIKIAHVAILDAELTDNWFEAGENVENLLYPIRGRQRRVEKLLKSFLPERRSFWARQCALSALALRGNKKARVSDSLWKLLVLVGRDIAAEVPLDKIPLMKQIAEMTVQAFEAQM